MLLSTLMPNGYLLVNFYKITKYLKLQKIKIKSVTVA